MKPFWYLGIDPGLNGAMAFYTNEPVEQLVIHNFVTFKIGSSSNQYHKANHRKEIAVSETAQIIRDFISIHGPVKLVVLENPHSPPNDGHVGAFRFGKAIGIIQGILGTLDLKVIPILPPIWKAQMNVKVHGGKKASIDRAKEIFGPDFDHEFKNAKDHDKAEAALLAYYGAKKFGGV